MSKYWDDRRKKADKERKETEAKIAQAKARKAKRALSNMKKKK